MVTFGQNFNIKNRGTCRGGCGSQTVRHIFKIHKCISRTFQNPHPNKIPHGG
ncbi:hypothetical protein C0J52_14238 [Blattella germanica]|nr:hypothetical protein C0J52_14238 [Blattella germanica]